MLEIFPAMPLSDFHPATRQWFAETFGEPTSAQRLGWGFIREGRHTLIAAPTGSGKTLAAFLTALDDLLREGMEAPLPDEVRVLYVSPLKALSADIHRNLAEPRRGIRRAAESLGLDAPRVTAAVRTGDTPQAERAAMLRRPPHILVTTPESLYLLLTAERSREILRTVRTVIVDEIHAVIGTRRGAHLALSLERLEQVTAARPLRLGLSATQKPVDEVARFLVGARQVDPDGRPACAIVDEGHRRAMDLGLEVPRSPLEAVMSHEVWEEYYDRLTALIRGHRTTLVFVNTRRMAERLARHLSDRLGGDQVTAHHGSLSKEKRLDAETRLKEGRLQALVATASLELGIDIGHVDLVCQIGSPHRLATLLQRVGRSGHTIAGMPKGRLFPTSRDDLLECIALLRAVGRGALDAIVPHDAPLDVLTQQIVAETSCAEYREDDLLALVRGAWPYRALDRRDFDQVVAMAAEGFATRRGRRAALLHRDEVHGRVRGRRGSRLLALTSGGAIPEVADYRVVVEPEETFIGTLNEDFAIESTAGDIFQLGNASWQIRRVSAGVVRVVDAKGAPPTIPFWLGEAPARSNELSQAVSDLRADLDRALTRPPAEAAAWLSADARISSAAADQAVAYLAEARRALGVIPTQHTLVLERFFDESGGMQLVLHAPFGSRVNRAWGLALRKRFCRQFNFELQAAATDDALLLSLGAQHSFPLADVFRYLHPATARDVLVQALLDAPVFQTRWRWNTTIALAVPRSRGGARVAPQLQRMQADDLLAAVFPDAAACLENIPGDRKIPDHPLVAQTLRDCLEEAMDFGGLARVLDEVHAGRLELVSRDTPEPSPLAHEILNARPYAFLDDAPLEERRTQAVYARRATEPSSAADLGALDADAIDRVREEIRPDPRDADELHDTLVTAGFLTREECDRVAAGLVDPLLDSGRAAWMATASSALLVAAERLPEMKAVHPAAPVTGHAVAPPSRAARGWTRNDAIVELLRGRLAMTGPATAQALARDLGIDGPAAEGALLVLEGEGVVLRGSFTPGATALEWCERRLLARIHRYTLNRLRAEIEPVSAADFMRYLFVWQHAHPSSRLSGIDGLRAVVGQLDGFEAAARSWEQSVLPGRLDRYDPGLLDALCLTGEVGWMRLSRPSSGEPAPRGRFISTTPVALVALDHAGAWRGPDAASPHETGASDPRLSARARQMLEQLRARGALFLRELAAGGGGAGSMRALGELVAAGLVTADSFAALRAMLRGERRRPDGRAPTVAPGRWSLAPAPAMDRDGTVEVQARALLRRYGVVFRRLLGRETGLAPWRDLARVFRRLEARGEIRGGRFVGGMSGEQFAASDAVSRLREVRRTPRDGRVVIIAADDPLNLAGLVTPGERVRAVPSLRVAYQDGVPIAALRGKRIRTLLEPAASGRPGAVAELLTGTVPQAVR
jgi:ATP-dependent Lhr-like helicase